MKVRSSESEGSKNESQPQRVLQFCALTSRMLKNKYTSPKSVIVCSGFCFKEVLFLINANALNFDQGLRNHIALTPNSISHTNLGCISNETENSALVP